jgi:hypothetical protein
VNKVASVLETKGEDWLVAAMVDGSIGYHSPQSARRLINQYLKDERNSYCERCYACFGTDLEKMILHDIECFEYLETLDPGKVERIANLCQEIEKLESVEQTTIGLLYPTMNI